MGTEFPVINSLLLNFRGECVCDASAVYLATEETQVSEQQPGNVWRVTPSCLCCNNNGRGTSNQRGMTLPNYSIMLSLSFYLPFLCLPPPTAHVSLGWKGKKINSFAMAGRNWVVKCLDSRHFKSVSPRRGKWSLEYPFLKIKYSFDGHLGHVQGAGCGRAPLP